MRLRKNRSGKYAMGQVLTFVAICPTCGREELQNTFTCAALERLIDGCYPIDAYCAVCDEFWTVNIRKRVEIIEAVSQSIRRRFLVGDNTSSAEHMT
jgi:hypothetical protein